jgi:hypothetical protein
LIFHLSYSQDFKINIDWQAPDLVEFEGNEYSLPKFTGVAYDNGKPLVFHKINLKSSNKKVKTVSFETGKCLNSEAQFLKKMGFQVNNDLQMDVKVTHAGRDQFLVVSGFPFIVKDGIIQKITSLDISCENILVSTPKDFALESVLRPGTGEWYKISVINDGIHKVDHDFLNSIGINLEGLNPNHVHIYGNGDGMLPELNSLPRTDDLAQNAVMYFGNADNSFDSGDYILFYAWGPNRWINNGNAEFEQKKNVYSDYSYYFININENVPARIIQDKPPVNGIPDETINSYDFRSCYENDLVSLVGGGQRWYGELFDIDLEQTFNFSVPNIKDTPAFFKTSIASNASNSTGTFQRYSVNGLILDESSLPITTSDYARSENAFAMSNPPSSIPFKVTIQRNSPNVLTYLDRISLNAKRELVFYGSQMGFRNLTGSQSGMGEFVISNYPSTGFLWDLTDRHNPQKIEGTLVGNSFSFLDSLSYTEYVVSNGGTYFSPVYVGAVDYQNLHALEQVDYLIVTNPLFLSEAERLAELHRNQGTTVHVVTSDLVYNEFSSGAKDAVAIRMFAKMFYDRSQTNPESAPKYLLLFGDGTYDPKDRVPDNNNLMLTYQVVNSENHISALVTDDFYGMLDDNESITGSDLLDIGIGRILASDVIMAKQQVDKIEHYMNNGSSLFLNAGASCCLDESSSNTFGDWRQKYVQVADDEEGGYFINVDTEPQYEFVTANHREMNCDKLYLDAYPQQISAGGQRYPDVLNGITDRVQRGAVLVNYVGHGGEVGLAEERVVTIPQINSWTNINALNVFVSATCEFTKYDDPSRVSAGEWASLNPTGGAIALMTTTRSVFFGVNSNTGEAFFENVFQRDANGLPLAFGEIAKRTKNNAGSNINKRSFTLIGDPALRIALPHYNIVTDSINGISPSIEIDTLKALSKVRVKGHLEDFNGLIMSDVNGILTPSILDKVKLQNTLGQDMNSPEIEYELQRNVIYKGKVSIVNGSFDFSFVVPKDIALNYGSGKLSYYGYGNQIDAGGYDTSFVIGGIDPNGISDDEGPQISLYMNDENFVTGGQTDLRPVLLAKIFDENGINTVGNGIGHDITAILDGNTSEPLILNDYYVSDLDSYQSGEIRFQFEELEKGRHTLEFKVWDVNNNSSKITIEFVVVDESDLSLMNVYNYPNPFTSSTEFMFEHPFSCNQLDVQIQIYTVSGKLVKSINETINTEGFRVNNIFWNGKDTYGDQLAKGVYIYRVVVNDINGSSAEKTEKLVILR